MLNKHAKKVIKKLMKGPGTFAVARNQEDRVMVISGFLLMLVSLADYERFVQPVVMRAVPDVGDCITFSGGEKSAAQWEEYVYQSFKTTGKAKLTPWVKVLDGKETEARVFSTEKGPMFVDRWFLDCFDSHGLEHVASFNLAESLLVITDGYGFKAIVAPLREHESVKDKAAGMALSGHYWGG